MKKKKFPSPEPIVRTIVGRPAVFEALKIRDRVVRRRLIAARGAVVNYHCASLAIDFKTINNIRASAINNTLVGAKLKNNGRGTATARLRRVRVVNRYC